MKEPEVYLKDAVKGKEVTACETIALEAIKASLEDAKKEHDKEMAYLLLELLQSCNTGEEVIANKILGKLKEKFPFTPPVSL